MEPITPIPEPLRRILTRLSFYSNVGENQKLCFSSMSFVDSNSKFSGIYRFFSGESGENLLNNIEKDIKNAISNIPVYTDTRYGQLLIDKLMTADEAIQRLIVTYDKKPLIRSSLEILHAEILLATNSYRQPTSQESTDDYQQ
ncbi:Hypothetical protein ORPV_1066 [Orpheovirus IHUMI-LCC2]|uniref:Uncharacterized protein n=1 Tax=Orpheovirus IHUMI-LCC2 TaxID=2023057 RepID=A0A2I2L649_9VIRU|nr:Hypothetical protein ORPV_1066 [Orpheovirus IHUMI-LCC2]SNW62970.1 Hypothetical protein ORPV_1066 [Orpheovirus IHUMI-LCC2]